ncbi:16S rRNA (uracil(1498)-N(3))-methyltransferase [Flavobacterium sp. NRK F10]|uniref:Ribosomal RNA small subunit methyltransferase E n=1 Tax=Flavobacterium sediminis TaxID=2201181 RepID=A0A2U8QYR4_9FLAO|nr:MULTISPECIES: 16S rRNA (uracil(1498)-N(3))-methyltransferase [Flavobacterium]AWM15360.1 16S rRNA (uracil(1498)-N(3))-methyltransferase [Flavobacterium sediminis]MCO6176176.1 16S rRNA (uracil(1498)-N(3))-methyltransferase [Flavobacterium sp. NRK F10]
MQLFYNANIQDSDTFFTFDKEESRHIVKVLRKSEGDIVFITNGLGTLFTSEISIASDKKCEVKITEIRSFPKSEYHLHIAVAPTKMNDRLEWFLEKATEIGIQEITPVICEHSERKVYKTDRAEKILQSAMKQSLQYYLPKINEPVSFKDFIQKATAQNKFIAHCVESERKSLKDCIKPKEEYLILIGPEGDFSEKEIELALTNNYQAVLLGNTRLRTETAALVACHTVALLNE